MIKHDTHTSSLIEIAATGSKALFRRKYLSHGNAMISEEFIISIDQFGLPYGRKELTALHTVQLVGKLQFTTS